ncbi:MAG: hypothetical protein GY835_05185, partial [bacterium]|nr:hypothetical protein [bacterium]
RIDPAELASETLRQQLASPGWHPMLPVVRAFMAAAALDALTTVFAQALEAEGRGLMAKRALAHQQAVAQQLKPEVNTNELTHQVRTCLQRQFGELERGVKQRLAREFTPQVGTLWQAIDGEIAGLDELAKEVKTRSIATRLRDEYRERLMACLHEKLSQHLIGDLVAMHDLFGVVADEVETLVKNAAGPLLVPQLNHLTDDRVHALLETNLVLNREY